MAPVLDSGARDYISRLNRYCQCMQFLGFAEELIHSKADQAFIALHDEIDEGVVFQRWSTKEQVDAFRRASVQVIQDQLKERNAIFKAALKAAFACDHQPSEHNLWVLEQFVYLIQQ